MVPLASACSPPCPVARWPGCWLQVMGVLRPLRVELTGRPAGATLVTVPDFPFDPARGTHTVPLDDVVFIDHADFRLEDEEDYFGLAPGKTVGLKYAFVIRCNSYETDDAGECCMFLR